MARCGAQRVDPRSLRSQPISINPRFMRTLRRIESVWSAWIAVALLGVLVRAFIPSGYMTSAERGPGFVICSGQTADVSGQKGGDPFHNGKSAAASCPFAVLQLAIETPTTASIGAPLVLFSEITTLAQSDLAPGLGLAAPPPPSTGPPALL